MASEYFVEVWGPCPTCKGSAAVATPAGGGSVDCPTCVPGGKHPGYVMQIVEPKMLLSGGYVRAFVETERIVDVTPTVWKARL